MLLFQMAIYIHLLFSSLTSLAKYFKDLAGMLIDGNIRKKKKYYGSQNLETGTGRNFKGFFNIIHPSIFSHI